jgi:hypothetical protein
MVLRAALILALLATPAMAVSARGTKIAMAVALLDVAQDHCGARVDVDEKEKERLMLHFHEYDIAGLASVLSRPLNAFYEDFSSQAKKNRDAFCRNAPAEAAGTGYPVLRAGAE